MPSWPVAESIRISPTPRRTTSWSRTCTPRPDCWTPTTPGWWWSGSRTWERGSSRRCSTPTSCSPRSSGPTPPRSNATPRPPAPTRRLPATDSDHAAHREGGAEYREVTMAVPPYVQGDDGTGRGRVRVDAGRLWTGGLATALVARGLFDVPVLAPTREGALGNANTARLAILAAAAALVATGLMHLLLLS